MPSYANREELIQCLQSMGGTLTAKFGQLTASTEQMLADLEADGLVEITTNTQQKTRTYRLGSKAKLQTKGTNNL